MQQQTISKVENSIVVLSCVASLLQVAVCQLDFNKGLLLRIIKIGQYFCFCLK